MINCKFIETIDVSFETIDKLIGEICEIIITPPHDIEKILNSIEEMNEIEKKINIWDRRAMRVKKPIRRSNFILKRKTEVYKKFPKCCQKVGNF